MPTKAELYAQMAEKVTTQLTGSWQEWAGFLTTASRLYKYPFHEQLMIYAQRPDATACAEYDLWNEKMGRYVRRGSKGIALVDDSGDRPRLRYVFDISDTGTREHSRTPWLWQLEERHLDSVQAMLERTYDVSGDDLAGQLTEVAGKLAEEYWSGAWQGIVSIFSGIVSGIANIFKAPINAIISGINTFINGINGIKIPDWVPGVGGMGFSIPNIPMLATGGFTEGITIAGEAGTEAVISFDRSVRAANIGYWEKAGEMLGVYDKSETALAGNLLSVDDFSLAELSQPSTTIVYDFSGFTWSPVIAGGKVTEDNDDLMQRLKAHEAEFFDWLERWIQTREVTAFA